MEASTTSISDYPLKDIANPHPHDVLCGRGGGTNNHIGNTHWRMLVAANKQLYITLPKRQKMLLSRSIVHAVRSQNPPGRFLQKDKSDKWYDIGDQRAQEKTSQALREGAPDLRNRLASSSDSQAGQTTLSPCTSVAGSSTQPDNLARAESAQSSASASNIEVTTSKTPPPLSPSPPAAHLSPAATGAISPPVVGSASQSPVPLGVAKDGSGSSPIPFSHHGGADQQQHQHQHQHQQQHPTGHGIPPHHHPPMPHAAPHPMMFPQVPGLTGSMMHGGHPNGMMSGGHPNAIMSGGHPNGMMPGGHPNGMNGMVPGGLPNGMVPGPGGMVPGPNNSGMMPGGHPSGPVMLYTSPTMAPMQGVPMMIMNEQGMMVQVMSYMPPQVPAPIPPQGPVGPPRSRSPQRNGQNQQQQQQQQQHQHQQYHQQQQHHQQQHQQHHHQQQQQSQQKENCQEGFFDEKIAEIPLPPDQGLDMGGLSFGSVAMSDAEQMRLSIGSISLTEAEKKQHLEPSGLSFGSAMSGIKLYHQTFGTATNDAVAAATTDASKEKEDKNVSHSLDSRVTQTQSQSPVAQAQLQSQSQNDSNQNEGEHAAAVAAGKSAGAYEIGEFSIEGMSVPGAVDGGLEPTGISFGTTFSLMEEDKKLEPTGISFGSMMSYKPEAVDGGLEAIGMSFGSMSLTESQHQNIQNCPRGPDIRPPDGADALREEAPAPLPPALGYKKSTGNLLEGSDTEDESEEETLLKREKKSQHWENFKATFEAQKSGGGFGGQQDGGISGIGNGLPSDPRNGFGNMAHEDHVVPTGQIQAQADGGWGAFDHNGIARETSEHKMPPPAPPALKKDSSDDWRNVEKAYLKRGDSLAFDEFDEKSS